MTELLDQWIKFSVFKGTNKFDPEVPLMLVSASIPPARGTIVLMCKKVEDIVRTVGEGHVATWIGDKTSIETRISEQTSLCGRQNPALCSLMSEGATTKIQGSTRSRDPNHGRNQIQNPPNDSDLPRHLRPLTKIISALYVIDLQKFRQIAAGDRLRGQYQGLSGDSNSLANLDQDLPNNMTHQDMIKSIPQEWLWCETWCDDGSKKNVKAIDFCNNQLTKEPKQRIIGEWKPYEDEIREVISGRKDAENVIDTENSHNEF
ncbi:unnamed protein product [Caenorhabditis brenneri]